MSAGMTAEITLAPLPDNDPAHVDHLSLPPEQHQFSDPPAAAMRAATAPRDGHMILEGDDIVGFFAIDPLYAAAHDFAQDGAIGVRMFSIDQRAQGRGIASRACQQLRSYLAAQYPQVARVYLTVNHRNPAARAAYLRGGFIDEGHDYLGGGAGPQHILHLDLR